MKFFNVIKIIKLTGAHVVKSIGEYGREIQSLECDKCHASMDKWKSVYTDGVSRDNETTTFFRCQCNNKIVLTYTDIQEG